MSDTQEIHNRINELQKHLDELRSEWHNINKAGGNTTNIGYKINDTQNELFGLQDLLKYQQIYG